MTTCYGCIHLYWKQGGPSSPKHSCKVHEEHMWVPNWCECKDRVDEKEVLYGKQVTTLKQLEKLSHLKMSVVCTCRRHIPAEVVMRMNGRTILYYMKNNMTVYTPKNKRKSED